MTKYNLLKLLQNPEEDKKTPLPKGIKYEQRITIVEGHERVVNIPTKEIEKFDAKITEHKSNLSRDEFNELLREVRGIREK